LNRYPALAFLVEHDLFRKPVSTFRDHAQSSGVIPPRAMRRGAPR
jgi:hypothetical protein